MARPQSVSIVLAAASATAACQSQTPLAAGPLVINGSSASGGVATFDVARRVIATTNNPADNGTTLALTGKDRGGHAIFETLVLNSTTAPFTFQDFLSVSIARISAGTTGTVSLGTNGVASAAWLPVDPHIIGFSVGIQVSFAGNTASIAIEGTEDDPDRAYFDALPSGTGVNTAAATTWIVPVAFPLNTAVTSDLLTGTIIPMIALRLTINSGATNGPVRMILRQAGI